MHPKEGDFSENNSGKILISTIHDDTYFTNKKTTKDDKVAQTADQTVVISAYVEPKQQGLTVYFEVIDPDDPVDNANEHYKEAQVPTTPLTGNNDLKAEVDSNPNDNRDPERTMYGGTLAKYNTFQGLLSARSATTALATIDGVERAVAEVTLTITNRYSGDNYIVRATCENPNNKPFNDNSGVTEEPDADAGIDEGKIKSTMVLTAWKRVYVEIDRMFRVGADLSDDSGVSQTNKNVIHVDTTGLNLAEGDVVRVFDTDDRLPPFGELRVVSSVEAGKIILTQNLTGDYETEKSAHVGKVADASNQGFKPYYQVEESAIKELWKRAFIDVVFSAEEGVFPYRETIPYLQALNLSIAWCQKATNDRANYYHMIGASKFGGLLSANFGATLGGGANCSYVLVGLIESKYIDIEDRINAIRFVTTHEFTHHFDMAPTLPGMNARHHQQPIPGVITHGEDETNCVMYFVDVEEFNYTVYPRWCVYHAYLARDQEDAKVN